MARIEHRTLQGQLIVSYSGTLAQERAEAVEAIKADAQRRITADWPEWKQLNIIRAGGAPLTAMSAAIDAIRAASNAAEAAVASATTADEVWQRVVF